MSGGHFEGSSQIFDTKRLEEDLKGLNEHIPKNPPIHPSAYP